LWSNSELLSNGKNPRCPLTEINHNGKNSIPTYKRELRENIKDNCSREMNHTKSIIFWNEYRLVCSYLAKSSDDNFKMHDSDVKIIKEQSFTFYPLFNNNIIAFSLLCWRNSRYKSSMPTKNLDHRKYSNRERISGYKIILL
jgi:hypothetical protein